MASLFPGGGGGFGRHGGMGRGAGRGRGGGAYHHPDETELKSARLPVLRLAGYLKPYKWQAAAGLFLSFLILASQLAPPRIIGIIIDRIVIENRLDLLNFAVLLLAGIFTAGAALQGLKHYLLGRIGQNIIHDLRTDTYRKLQRLSLSFYDSNQTGSMMSRVTNDVNEVERVIVEGADTFLVAVFTLIGIMFILIKMNPALALTAAIPVPMLFILTMFVVRRAHSIYRQVRKDLGEMNALLQDNISGIREIKSFSQEEYEEERFRTKSGRYFESNIKAVKLWAGVFPQIMFFVSLGTVLVLWHGGRLNILHGSPSAGELVSFLFYLNLFYMPVRQLNMFNHMLQHARAASERIFEVIDSKPSIRDAADAVNLPDTVRGEVRFKDVKFSYKKGVPVLHGVSFTANRGELIALVGKTGAGKSTIAALIPRFYEPDSGIITVDGIDIRKIRLKDLSSRIGIVAQEPFLFNGTVFDNISYGRPGASLEEAVWAARAANAHDFISRLPEGYENEVGERGIKLSVGEKQRIAIARALLKDPPILILDEATSSVDVHTERLIQEALERLITSRTSFVIAHRLSTIRKADRILVIESGRIAEEGSHEELLEKGSIYRDLYKIQIRTGERKD